MTEHSDLIPDLDSEDVFEVQMRGYSRRQVNEFVARSRSQTRDSRSGCPGRSIEVERLRAEVAASRQRELEDKPPIRRLSERMAQILRLADDEAKAQKSAPSRTSPSSATTPSRRSTGSRPRRREQTERMLAAAQEQAENTIATARAEAEKARNSARC